MTSPFKLNPIGDNKQKPLDMKGIKLTTIDMVGGIYCNICRLTIGNKKDFDRHYMQHKFRSTEVVYTCVICYKEFVGYPSFRGHCYLVHVTRNKFKCEHCPKVFSKQCILQTHINKLHKKIYKCEVCLKQFENQKELNYHKLVHTTPPYNCQVCGKELCTFDECEYHVENHCSKFYPCPICNEEIIDIQKASNHLIKHFGDEVKKEDKHIKTLEQIEISNESSIDLLGIFCHYCDSTYKTRLDFDTHYAAEHPDKDIVYACNICGREFQKYLMFASHCYDHSAKDRFQCDKCFRAFSRLSRLVLHTEAHYSGAVLDESEYTLPCTHCSQSFKTHRRLQEHVRSVHNDYTWQCQEQGCGKLFDSPRDLVLHLKDHHSVRDRCQLCGLRCNTLQSCERHLPYHMKATYNCPICNRQYGEKYLVTKHLQQHFPTVFHACKLCSKIYKSKSRLVEHMKVHNVVRPYLCSYCTKGFTKPYLLNQHLNTHTGDKPFKCTICAKTFACNPNLRKHMSKVHNNKRSEKRNVPNENNNQSDIEKDLKCTVIKNENLKASNTDTVVLDNNNIKECLPREDIAIETSVDMSNIMYNIDDSSESCSQWSSEIDPMVLKGEDENIDSIETTVNSMDDFQKDLWVNSPAILESPSEAKPLVPREYGPEFVSDDAPLPHIDPHLTLLPHQEYDACVDLDLDIDLAHLDLAHLDHLELDQQDYAQLWTQLDYDARAQVYQDII